MNMNKIGPLEIIMGENQSRMPFSTSIIVKGDDYSTLFECGSGKKAFEYIKKEHRLGQIFLTHHHMDHTWGLIEFSEIEVFINPLDQVKLADREELIRAQGFPAVLSKEQIKRMEQEADKLPHAQYHKAARRLFRKYDTYNYGTVMDLSGVKVIFIYSPGHTEGYCCPYFPEHGVIYTGDFDLTSFGPFYCDADGDIDLFIESANKLLEVDAKYYVTAHQRGMMTKDQFKKELENYLSIIDRREETIKQFIKAGKPVEELIHQGIFYYKDQLYKNPFYLKSEKVGIAKHIKRMIRNGEPLADYYEQYLKVHNINEKYITYTVKSKLQYCH